MNHIINIFERSERHIRKLCGLSHQPRGRAVSSRCAGLVLVSAVVAFLTQTPALAQIAARYPRDKNIASDPAVIFADDFESYTNASQLATKWSKVAHVEHMRIATETANRFSGAKAVEMSLPISSKEVSASLEKTVDTDTLFVRVYEKWATNYYVTGSNHNGISILGGTLAGPCTPAPANGTGFFIFQLQNILSGRKPAGMTPPGYDQIYAYWPKQRSDCGDHWFPDGWVQPPGGNGDWLLYSAQYDDFRAMPNHLPQRNRWYCYEMMVRANTPWLNDGEVKWWVDGKLTADFLNLKIRSISTLQIDTAMLVLGANRTTQVVKKWYDNVVIAKHYIGPMVSP